MENKTLYLIDGSSYCYRAFYALGRLTNARGMATQAIYGFAQMLFKVMREKNPDYLCVVFDAYGPTFRHEMYKDYKATRLKMPEDLAAQLPYIKDLVRYHGVAQLEMVGYEADDIIASLVDRARAHGLQVVIVSADKDLHQLIKDPWVKQWDPQKDRLITAKGVEERFGIKPEQIVDLLALMGDSSDNVPGVPGVGEKTARKLLQQYGSLDQLYDHLDDVSQDTLRHKLAANRELAELSRQLVTLIRTVPIDIQVENLVPGTAQVEELTRFYQELGFKGLLDSLHQQWGVPQQHAMAVAAKASCTPRLITHRAELTSLLERLSNEQTIAIHLTTTSPNPMQAHLLGVALSWQDHEACYLPLARPGQPGSAELAQDAVLEALTPFLGSTAQAKVGHDLKHAWMVLQRHGIHLRAMAADTMVASYLLDPGKRSHRLELIAAEHLGEEIPHLARVVGKGKDQSDYAQVDIDTAAARACTEVETIWRLAPILLRKLEETGLRELFATLEVPLIEVLARMELHGIVADPGKLDSLAWDLEKSLQQLSDQIFQLAGMEFNIQSPKQLADVLFGKLGLRVVKKTKSGPSTDVEVLEALAAEHAVVEHLLRYRGLAKLKGTYADTLPRLINPTTRRIHTSFNQTVTATGRLSSSDPNLQNIPIRTEEGRKIRAAFIPAPGHVLMAADYSQVELRILAHLSQDAHLLAAFAEGEDIHRRTAAEMLGIPPHAVTPEMRRQAKTINFGIIYGMGPFGLARALRISNSSARAAIERYFQRYRGVKEFIEQVVREARQHGYCSTLLGRRRAIPEIASRNRTLRQQGERLAINTTIQGTAADLIKKAMLAIDHALQVGGHRSAMLLQVHDELVFEVAREELEEVKQLVEDKMEHVLRLSVPLKVDMGWGHDWAEAHP